MGGSQADWLRDRRVSWMWFAAFGVAALGWLAIPGAWGALLAAAGFTTAGGLCAVNAVRCRRVHCVVTAPVYLLAGLAFLLRAGGANVAAHTIIAAAAVGTIVGFIPEWLGRRYWNSARDRPAV